MKFNLHNKEFRLLQNSESGEVDKSTLFKYTQDDNFVSAEYHGGTIRYGKIIATLDDDVLDMLYQCVTHDGILKAGRAKANISTNEENKIILHLKWQWLNGNQESGESTYLEC